VNKWQKRLEEQGKGALMEDHPTSTSLAKKAEKDEA